MPLYVDLYLGVNYVNNVLNNEIDGRLLKKIKKVMIDLI